MIATDQKQDRADLFAGDGEMSRLMRAHDWAATPLGPAEIWPQSLRIVVRILLGSRYAMWLGWGPDFTFLYNDAYARMTLGAKHPWALGRSAREVWAEIWNDIGPRAESVVRTGRATWDERLLLFLERRGFAEETYHTFSYSPVPDDAGGVGGMLCVVTEDTERTIGERRLKTLRELAAGTTEAARSAEAACRAAARILAGNPHDLPFALLYLIDATDDRAARLAGATGLPPESPAAPPTVSLSAPAEPDAGWPLRAVLEAGRGEVVTGIGRWLGPHPVGVYPEPPHTAAVLPVRKSGQDLLAGFLVAGVSPRRPFDDDYRGFFDLLAGQIATAVANARAYEEERRRAEALAELDRAKTTFFSNVSHEFRTPLTLMLGPVQDVLSGADGALPPPQRERLEVARRNALRLQKLVNTLLDFSRIEAGRVRASFEPTDLAAFTTELASSFRSACERAGLGLSVDCPPLPEPVYVDREMWEKIVLNLLSNAFKFTLDGRIEIELRHDRRVAELVVRDSGSGIPADQIPHLFERFHRVEGTRGRTQEGSGIGLALVRELVRLHGGDVRAESLLGEGSTFRVTVPLGTAHLPPERIKATPTPASTAVGATAYVQEALRWLPSDRDEGEGTRDEGKRSEEETCSGPAILSSLVPHPSSLPDKPRVLLADDNADMREYVRRLLAGRYAVTAVADGLAARDSVRRRPPDLVLSDVMMPGLDGFGLLRELRADPKTRVLPVILLSARAGEEARVEGLRAGADDYLTKPFSARELLARVDSTLEIARLRREAEAALCQSEQRWRTMAEALPNLVWTDLPDGRCDWLSSQWGKYTGIPEQELLGLNWLDRVLHPDDRERTLKCWQDACADRGDYDLEYRIRRHDGQYRWFKTRGVPVRDDAGKIVYWFGTCTDIEDVKRLEEALRDADRRKDEFLATLAHELRNPLAPIRNALQILEMPRVDAATARRSRDMMGRQVQHLVRLVDDLLDVSRVMRGKITLRKERVELATVVARAVETTQPLIQSEGHTLSVDLPDRSMPLDADPVRLAQVVGNLLTNAAKYTESNGRIWLTARPEGGTAVLAVRDTGIGIPPDLLPKVFDLFVQADHAANRSQGGLGIGLTLVKNLIEMHGGSVEARSDGPGRGSEFVVRLPLVGISNPGPDPAGEAPPTKATPGLRLLVVDDNRDAADSLATLLRMRGHEVRVAYNGPAALAAVDGYRPDAAFLDLGMPGMDGYEVARRLRGRPGLDGIRLAAVTGWGQQADRRRTAEAGFDHHLVKPPDPQVIERLLAELTPR